MQLEMARTGYCPSGRWVIAKPPESTDVTRAPGRVALDLRVRWRTRSRPSGDPRSR